MTKIKGLATILAISLVFAIPAGAQRNIADEVIWIVGDDPILRSDVEAERLNSELSGQQYDGDPFCRIAELIAVQKLFLHQAEIDSIEVTESEVQSEISFRENQYLQNFGSTERIEQFTKKRCGNSAKCGVSLHATTSASNECNKNRGKREGHPSRSTPVL